MKYKTRAEYLRAWRKRKAADPVWMAKQQALINSPEYKAKRKVAAAVTYRKMMADPIKRAKRLAWSKHPDRIKWYKWYVSSGNRQVKRTLRNQHPTIRYGTYIAGAKSRGLAFRLSFTAFMSFWQKSCSYCGTEISTIGLDRINNNRGYYKDNVTPCCTKCNIAKGNRTPDEYVSHCKSVANFK